MQSIHSSSYVFKFQIVIHCDVPKTLPRNTCILNGSTLQSLIQNVFQATFLGGQHLIVSKGPALFTLGILFGTGKEPAGQLLGNYVGERHNRSVIHCYVALKLIWY